MYAKVNAFFKASKEKLTVPVMRMPFVLNALSHVDSTTALNVSAAYVPYDDPFEAFMQEAGLTGTEDFLEDAGFLMVDDTVVDYKPVESIRKGIKFKTVDLFFGSLDVRSCDGIRYQWIKAGMGKVYGGFTRRLTSREIAGTWRVGTSQCTYSNLKEKLDLENRKMSRTIRRVFSRFVQTVKKVAKEWYDYFLSYVPTTVESAERRGSYGYKRYRFRATPKQHKTAAARVRQTLDRVSSHLIFDVLKTEHKETRFEKSSTLRLNALAQMSKRLKLETKPTSIVLTGMKRKVLPLRPYQYTWAPNKVQVSGKGNRLPPSKGNASAKQ